MLPGKLLIGDDRTKRRRRKASLSDSEIMTIMLLFHFGSFRNFKHYYLFYIKGTLKSYFPNAVSYNRFVELESRVFFPLMFFLNLQAFGRCTGITFVDSTMIPVCHNLRRYTNKTFSLFFLPPYSPQLNIAETLWRILKGKWIRPQDYITSDMLFYTTNRALADIGKGLCINFSKHVA